MYPFTKFGHDPVSSFEVISMGGKYGTVGTKKVHIALGGCHSSIYQVWSRSHKGRSTTNRQVHCTLTSPNLMKFGL